jgi:HK97 family phage major capsid protein
MKAAQTAPKFERLTYSIEDYAGYIPLTNDLIEDNNPTHITEVVTEWLARASVACDNREILAAIKTKDETALKGLDDIKKSINVTLGQAYASAAIIVTNDDGLNYLDTLKDTTGRDLLNPDPTAPANMRLRIGANLIPVKVVPNTVLKTTTNKVPFIIGDLKEAVKFFDRQKVTLKASDIATVGGKSAFESNLTYIRAIERMNVKVKDKNAFVNGFITVGE